LLKEELSRQFVKAKDWGHIKETFKEISERIILESEQQKEAFLELRLE